MSLADQVATEVLTQKPAALFIDGGGIGSGVIDRLRQLHINVIPVDFGGDAIDAIRFRNRRSEMWYNMAERVKKQGCIPVDHQLKSERAAPLFEWVISNKKTRFELETKSDMLKRGVQSPDRADSLALTFAAPVMSAQVPEHESSYYPRVHGPGMNKIVGGTEDSWNPYGED